MHIVCEMQLWLWADMLVVIGNVVGIGTVRPICSGDQMLGDLSCLRFILKYGAHVVVAH